MLMLALFIVSSCSSNTFEPEKENVEVERVLAEVRKSEESFEELKSEGIEGFEYENSIKIPISLREFLYNYYEIADTNDLQVVDKILDPILYHSLTIGSYPYVSVNFNMDKDNTIRDIACFKDCTEDYQDAIKEALKLSKLKYDKSYTIDEYYEDGEDGERYDVFHVIGK